MLIRILLRNGELLDQGFDIGETHDVPPMKALDLIRRGLADIVETKAVHGAPENK